VLEVGCQVRLAGLFDLVDAAVARPIRLAVPAAIPRSATRPFPWAFQGSAEGRQHQVRLPQGPRLEGWQPWWKLLSSPPGGRITSCLRPSATRAVEETGPRIDRCQGGVFRLGDEASPTLGPTARPNVSPFAHTTAPRSSGNVGTSEGRGRCRSLHSTWQGFGSTGRDRKACARDAKKPWNTHAGLVRFSRVPGIDYPGA